MAEDMLTPLEMLLAGKTEEALAAYRELKARVPKDQAIDENRLNSLGYGFLGDKKLVEALAVFKLNVELYPESWNAYDSLAEAYMTNGDKEPAILNYEKSLALNPNNVNGAAMLKKLKGE